MNFTRQFDKMDCGPACVRMIASHFGRNYPLSYLRPMAQMTREGVSVAGIRRALEGIGMAVASFRMTRQQLFEECPLPAILYWEQRHFVVLERINRRGKPIICDPAFGRHTMEIADFDKAWLNGDTGVVIAAEPSEKFYKKNSIGRQPNVRSAPQLRS